VRKLSTTPMEMCGDTSGGALSEGSCDHSSGRDEEETDPRLRIVGAVTKSCVILKNTPVSSDCSDRTRPVSETGGGHCLKCGTVM